VRFAGNEPFRAAAFFVGELSDAIRFAGAAAGVGVAAVSSRALIL